MSEVGAEHIIGGLLEKAGLQSTGFSSKACAAGGNNRVIRVDVDGKSLVAKWYFTSKDDQRDRLESEWRFLQYADAIGLECVPKPVSRDDENRVALYDFIEGKTFDVGTYNATEVMDSARFLFDLNTSDALALAPNHHEVMPDASEACFSTNEHLAMLDGRIAKLTNISQESETDQKAAVFIKDFLNAWEVLKNSILENSAKLGIDPDYRLQRDEQFISPSDFGFHNAIAHPQKGLCFIDFEYAGWDDPVKAISDFFFQPAIPVDNSYYQEFRDLILKTQKNPEFTLNRLQLLRPIFGFKWCCIILNAFIPEWSKRRVFANPETELENMKIQQLAKAEKAFKNMREMCAAEGVHF